MTLTLLDRARVWNMGRFLLSERDEVGGWVLVHDLYYWAKGDAPYPAISVATLPGHE